MSASNTPSTLCVAGEYCDGHTSIAHPVNALFSHATLVLVAPDVHRTELLADVQVSAPLGRLPRTFSFADGATLVVPSSEALSRQLGESTPGLQRWESRYRYAALALVLLLTVAWWMVAYAIPFAADAAVARWGAQWESAHSGDTLAQWDAAGVWKPSQLDKSRQAQARQTIASRLSTAQVDPERIAFRNSAQLGANAFALDGGDMVLTDDLMRLLTTEEQIAVVAHELGHVHHRHNQRLWLRQVGLLGALHLLMGGAWSDPVSDTTQLLGQTRYSREFEADADAYAVDLLNASGIAPCHLASSLQKLDAAAPAHGKAQVQWLSSHPLTQDRIQKAGGGCTN